MSCNYQSSFEEIVQGKKESKAEYFKWCIMDDGLNTDGTHEGQSFVYLNYQKVKKLQFIFNGKGYNINRHRCFRD